MDAVTVGTNNAQALKQRRKQGKKTKKEENQRWR